MIKNVLWYQVSRAGQAEQTENFFLKMKQVCDDKDAVKATEKEQ